MKLKTGAAIRRWRLGTESLRRRLTPQAGPDHRLLAVITSLAVMWTAAVPRLVEAVEVTVHKFNDQTYTVALVDLRQDQLHLFYKDQRGRRFKRLPRLEQVTMKQGKKLVFAMNAGMFHRDYSPVGLLVMNGVEHSPLNLRDGRGNFFLKPNGVFSVANDGARIVESSKAESFASTFRLATQSGPLLVSAGKIHPAFNPRSTSRRLRNGVGLRNPFTAVFAISERPVTFHAFATFFRDVLGCPDALYLDGTVSSLHVTSLGRTDADWDLGPILGVTKDAK